MLEVPHARTKHEHCGFIKLRTNHTDWWHNTKFDAKISWCKAIVATFIMLADAYKKHKTAVLLIIAWQLQDKLKLCELHKQTTP